MKLLHVLTLRLTLVKAVVFAFWAVLFYFAIISEINDETDDALEDQAELVIRRKLAGEPLPDASNGTNNQYFLREVSEEYVRRHGLIRYEDREIYIEQKRETEPARTVSYIFTDDDGRLYEVVVFTPTIDKADLKEAILWWTALLYVAMIVCLAIVNWRTLQRSMTPLHQVLRWLDAYRLGSPNPPLGIKTRIAEFARLADAVERSAQRNEQLYEQQKRFLANASHELQTPLAVIQSRLEMMLEEGPLTEQQMGDIVKTLRSLKGLSRTNRSLLLLSKIDNGQFTATQRVSIGEAIDRIQPDMQALYAHRRLTVTTHRNGEWCPMMDASLADALVANLLKNAFIHSDVGGQIVVSTSANMLRVANTGAAGPLDAGKIFEPFYHSPANASSTGLGLSIVKAICRLYDMQIDYRYENAMHVFEISGKAGA